MTLVAALALAQDVPETPPIDLQRWTLPFDAQGLAWTSDAADTPKGWYDADIVAGFQHAPVVYSWSDGSKDYVVEQAFSTAVRGAYSFGRVRAGVEVPMLLGVRGATVDAPASLGDVLVDVKAVALDHDALVGLAFLGRVWAPTTAGSGADWAGSAPHGELLAALDVDAGKRASFAINTGVRFSAKSDFGNVAIGNAVLLRAGGAWHVTGPLWLGADLAGDVNVASPPRQLTSIPLELLVGGHLRIARRLDVRLAGGRGFTRGIGSPDARVVLSVGISAERIWDADGDGITDRIDGCPHRPEDFDGFQDPDGCPEEDNDLDGILDLVDSCRDVPEDHDLYVDSDGCPDPNTMMSVRAVDPENKPVATAHIVVSKALAGDGSVQGEVPPGDYRLTIEADGFQDVDIPLTIVDGPPVDRVEVLKIQPRGTLEVKVTDPAGKPVGTATWKTHKRGLPPMTNGSGRALLPAGVTEIVIAAPGFVSAVFPAAIEAQKTSKMNIRLRPAHVKVTREKLVFTDKIFFDTNKSVIKKPSFPLLDEIVSIMKDRSDILSVRIEGHTDSRNSDDYNLKLSDARAAAVRKYLTDHGISPDRLTSVGYGESRPLDPRDVPAAWDKNRRVEFFIEKWDE